MNLISGFPSLFELDAFKRLSSRCFSTRDGGSCVSSSSWRIPDRAWKCLRTSRSLSKRYLGALFMITWPRFELLFLVRDDGERSMGGLDTQQSKYLCEVASRGRRCWPSLQYIDRLWKQKPYLRLCGENDEVGVVCDYKLTRGYSLFWGVGGSVLQAVVRKDLQARATGVHWSTAMMCPIGLLTVTGSCRALTTKVKQVGDRFFGIHELFLRSSAFAPLLMFMRALSAPAGSSQTPTRFA